MRAWLAGIFLCLCNALPAQGQGTGDLPAGLTHVGLLEGWRQSDGTYVAAVEIRLVPGWHTYWRTPGTSGIAPLFDWSGSRNLAGITYEWPLPEVFDSFGDLTIGYHEELVLPLLVRPRDPRASVDLVLELFFGVCDQICVPAQASLKATLAADAPGHNRARIEAALARRAQDAAEAGITGVRCRIAQHTDGYALVSEITFAAAPTEGQIVTVETARPDVWIGATESETAGRTLRAETPFGQSTGEAGPVLGRSDLRLTVIGATRAIDIPGCHAPG